MKPSHSLPTGARAKSTKATVNGPQSRHRSSGASKSAASAANGESRKVGNKGPAAKAKAKGKANVKGKSPSNGRSHGPAKAGVKAEAKNPAALPKGNDATAKNLLGAGLPTGLALTEEELLGVLMSRYNRGDDYNKANVLFEPRAAQALVPGSAVAVFPSYKWSDTVLASEAYKVADDGASTPYFTTLVPAAADILGLATAFTTLLTEQKATLDAYKMKTTQKDQARTELEAALKAQMRYVQNASLGDGAAIESVGYRLRAAATPTGDLLAPTGLDANPGADRGMMNLSWLGRVRCPRLRGAVCESGGRSTPAVGEPEASHEDPYDAQRPNQRRDLRLPRSDCWRCQRPEQLER